MKENHRTTLGACYLACSAPLLLAAMIVFLVVAGAGLLSGNATAIAVTTPVGTGIAMLLFLIATPNIVAGVALLRNLTWAKPLALVMAVFNLLAFPFGTALSLYAFWVFREDLDRGLGSDRSVAGC